MNSIDANLIKNGTIGDWIVAKEQRMSENIVCTFKDAHFAELVLRVLDEVEYPRLMCEGEKEAVRKGLMLLLGRQPVEVNEE